MAILFFAVPVEYASRRFVSGDKNTLWASFAKEGRANHRLLL